MSQSGAEWGGGYVTDVAYLPGYYHHQSPLHLHLACLLGGVTGLAITPESPLSYLELGCGCGFGTLALAASNPSWQVTGIDFSPAHIAAARELADEAGIVNARFIEGDLADLAESDRANALPEADVITLHGLWSWVGDPVRAGIVRLLDRKLRPGGIAYISYNALPGWQQAIGMQRLVREAGQRGATRSDRQVEAGIEIVRALVEADAQQLSAFPLVRTLLDVVDRGQLSYLAHEYMNAAWRPCFHADVVRDMAAAKLDWVASAELLENFSPLMLGDQARAVMARFEDPIMRELIKDLCASRCLRRDVFVRGARRLSAAERDEALGDVMLALLRSEAQFNWEMDVPAGRAAIERGFFEPVVAALGEGPRRVRDLLALPDLPRRDNPGELIGVLVGTNQAMPVLASAREPDATVGRFNSAAARHFVRPDNLNTGMALASSGSGAPLPAPMLDLFVATRLQEGERPDPDGWANMLGSGQSVAERQRLAAFIERLIAERMPLWRQLGCLPAAAPSR
jgi:SAM-dependent methyltransferase